MIPPVDAVFVCACLAELSLINDREASVKSRFHGRFAGLIEKPTARPMVA